MLGVDDLICHPSYYDQMVLSLTRGYYTKRQKSTGEKQSKTIDKKQYSTTLKLQLFGIFHGEMDNYFLAIFHLL